MKLKPTTRIYELAASPLLDDLDGAALVVYLRVVAASGEQGNRIQIKNRKLHAITRTATRCLQELEKAKLVRLHFSKTEDGIVRTVELL